MVKIVTAQNWNFENITYHLKKYNAFEDIAHAYCRFASESDTLKFSNFMVFEILLMKKFNATDVTAHT